jgi:glycosyltransferase involved in cell wall biosynthesis
MGEELKFGIYTSFYNNENFIDRIFENIEQISYENFEWHITDDFSSDNTREVLLSKIESSSMKNKIFFIEQQRKKEMYWRPDSFFDDTFDWIVVIDSDDIFDPEFLNIYNKAIIHNEGINLISSDFHKLYEESEELHSISYIINDDMMSKKINRYHPYCDYLNNISYSCFGHLRAFKHRSDYNFVINDATACADDSYRVLWVNSFGKYLHIPRPFYKWIYRKNSESHTKNPPINFNANFEIALNKLKENDFGVSTEYNDVYLETCSLGSFEIGGMKNKNVSLWTRNLSDNQKYKIKFLYPDVNLKFNDQDSEIHVINLNYFNGNELNINLEKIRNKKMMFYYQNQKFHSDNSQKDIELEDQLNYYKNIIGFHTNYSWWSYIRHFIIKN